MKHAIKVTGYILFLLISSAGIQAQSGKTSLNQVELGKQFAGVWQGDISSDTSIVWDIRNNGTGMECNFK